MHTTNEWGSLVRRVAERKIVVPLRKPASVWRSWCRRHEGGNFPYAEYYLAWGALQALDNMYALDVICVDKQEDPRITDWGKVGDEDASRARWQLIKIDQRPMYKLPLVLEHYGPHTTWQG